MIRMSLVLLSGMPVGARNLQARRLNNNCQPETHGRGPILDKLKHLVETYPNIFYYEFLYNYIYIRYMYIVI